MGLASARTMIVAMTQAMVSDSTRVKTTSSWSNSSLGPGSSPCSTMAPRNTAVSALPGMPKARVGISEPPSLALLADSGAITPLMLPRP